MRRSNVLPKFTVFVLLITMIALILVSGTYAKYTSTATGYDTATVAKWKFTVGGTDITKENTVTFDIFKTLTSDTAADGTISAVDGSLIAPGTAGNFDIQLKNESEVKAEYKISYKVTNGSGIPLEYTTNPNGTWETDINRVLPTANNGFTEIAIGATVTTPTIYWRWQFDNNNDANDTALGIQAATSTPPQVIVEATITAQQVD